MSDRYQAMVMTGKSRGYKPPLSDGTCGLYTLDGTCGLFTLGGGAGSWPGWSTIVGQILIGGLKITEITKVDRTIKTYTFFVKIEDEFVPIRITIPEEIEPEFDFSDFEVVSVDYDEIAAIIPLITD